jgi:hypothetical protein
VSPGLRFNDVEPPPDANGHVYLEDGPICLLNYHSHYWLLVPQPQQPQQQMDRRWALPA